MLSIDPLILHMVHYKHSALVFYQYFLFYSIFNFDLHFRIISPISFPEIGKYEKLGRAALLGEGGEEDWNDRER